MLLDHEMIITWHSSYNMHVGETGAYYIYFIFFSIFTASVFSRLLLPICSVFSLGV